MTDVIAYTKYGKVCGDYFDSVYRFLGIRYAKPPVGRASIYAPPTAGCQPSSGGSQKVCS